MRGFFDYLKHFQVLLEEQGLITTIDAITELINGVTITFAVNVN